MNIGFFGGSFDPIHRGHLALARAAQEAFQLRCVYFVPANIPPHKERGSLAPYLDRRAMAALATAGEKSFMVSSLEAPELTNSKEQKQNYTIDTVRSLKPQLKKADKLFVLMGIDAFKDIAKWHQAEALFRECEFIVASRPGFSLADVANSLPAKLRPSAAAIKPFNKEKASGALILPGVHVHLLDGVHEKVSATSVREAIRAGRALGKLVDPAVADYIAKHKLYRSR
jgi:nicotinate-nucleotide adenylyltransferase